MKLDNTKKENKAVNITFVLGANSNKAVGGFKIVYQYANYLQEKGNQVNIVFLYSEFIHNVFIRKMDRFVSKHLWRRSYYQYEVTWFNLHPEIRLFHYPITFDEFPDADRVFATSARTVSTVKKLPESKGTKFYFIQNYEAEGFGNTKEFVENTYTCGMNNIVISHELRNKVLASGAPEPNYLPNFYNHQEFYLEEPIEKRENIVALLNHQHATKRTKLGLEILREVKKEIPNLKVELFGTYEPVEELESNVHFTRNATTEQLRKDIFGQAKIYLLPSILEGWVLTGMEAMASGAAVVSSRIGGITDYANDDNSILIEPDNKQAFVEKIIQLLKNNEEQVRIATRGNQDVQQYSIDISGEKLVEILSDISEEK